MIAYTFQMIKSDMLEVHSTIISENELFDDRGSSNSKYSFFIRKACCSVVFARSAKTTLQQINFLIFRITDRGSLGWQVASIQFISAASRCLDHLTLFRVFSG